MNIVEYSTIVEYLTIIVRAPVGYEMVNREIGYSQLGPAGPVGYNQSYIQQARME